MSRSHSIPLLALLTLLWSTLPTLAQRTYTGQSVLATGNWYKIAVNGPGIYKIDLPFLNSLGINTSSLSSGLVQLFGNGGQPLSESPAGPRVDDLAENALWVEDGGDGILNGNDYILFYAPGPHQWKKDSLQRRFIHQKNPYSEQSFYYLTIGSNGKRIKTANPSGNPPLTITSFNERYFYERDTFNFLSSGREWYGEEFSDAPGKVLSRSFQVAIPGITPEPAWIVARCLARSFGAQSRFSCRVNGQSVLQMNVPAVSNGAYDPFARTVQAEAGFSTAQSPVTIGVDYATGSVNSQGWLDWFELFARRQLSFSDNSPLFFRDWNSVGAGIAGRFTIGNAGANSQVWDITEPLEPVRIQGSLDGPNYSFVNDCSRLREYVALNNTGFLTPVAIGRIPNQNLHQPVMTDMLLIAHPSLLVQAQRLAQYHQQRDQLRTLVVTTDQVFNEFSSGTPDPAAIRDFTKMFYDRSGGDSTKRPKYLLLFGAASFDYKNRISNNTNLVPAWESPSSLDPLSTHTSDDFFGLLDDGDDVNGTGIYLLDIGIGRIPAQNDREAANIVNKILGYHGAKALGAWRNELTFVADDGDNNLHFQDAEEITRSAAATAPVFNIDKIYLDAFRKESGPGGSRYPEVNQAIDSRFFSGTLIWNYTGHGGYRRLAEEVVLDQDIINAMNNPDKLPLFITATCDFAPYDNPLISSIGENLLLRERTGAIALMTTTRLVFAFSNRIMNRNYLESALKQQPDGHYLSLGDAVRRAKNNTYTFFGDVVNNRKFTLLGDPALTLAFPAQRIKTTHIGGVAVGSVPDTLKALSEYTISGEVTDLSGNTLTDFNGTVYPVIFDKKQTRQTLANDPGSQVASFQVQENILFKGKATVTNGQFKFKFLVPKDINYQFGNGKFSYYGENGRTDANGFFTNIIVGGSGTGVTDKDGPSIQAWLNDEKFVNGGITNDRPLLLVKLADSSGINIMGTSIGHDLVAILDHDQQKQFVLNQFYESELDNYRKGRVRFQLPALADGLHTLTIKAWDAANNSNELTIEFRVVNTAQFSLEHVLNYPNPFTTHTTFWFDHNRPGEELIVQVQIYTVSGKLVKSIRRTIFSSGNRSSEVEWDGRDEYGSKIGRGVYIYRLQVTTADGKRANKLEKLYIL